MSGITQPIRHPIVIGERLNRPESENIPFVTHAEPSTLASAATVAYFVDTSTCLGQGTLIDPRWVLTAARLNPLELAKISVVFNLMQENQPKRLSTSLHREVYGIKKILPGDDGQTLVKLKHAVLERVPSQEKDKSSAYFKLGRHYVLRRKFKEGLNYFLKAAELGHCEAKWDLYLLYASSQTGLQDKSERDRWLRSYISDGIAYFTGEGKEKDHSRAANIFRNGSTVHDPQALHYHEQCPKTKEI